MKSQATVYVVDDQKDVRDTVQSFAESMGLRVKSFGSAERFLDAFATPGTSTACLVLDVRMPKMTGLELLEHLRDEGAAIPTIMISAYADVPTVVRAMKLGALDFLEKPFSKQELIQRIHDAIEVDQHHRLRADQTAEIRAALGTLSPRESEVMELIVAGKLNKQISQILSISQKTVEDHRAQVMKKTRAGSVARLVQMVMLARANGNGQPWHSLWEDSEAMVENPAGS